jgi:hypothetical protein
MYSLNVPDTQDLIRYVGIRKKRPIMLWGAGGVGKSRGVHQLAEQDNALLIDTRLSQYDSVDLRGIPNVTHHETVWNVPAVLPFKGVKQFEGVTGPIYWFLDEVNAAQLSVLAVAYQIVLDRRCGEHELMDNVVIIAAGNREGDRGVTTRMPQPLANRFVHVEVVADVKAVGEYFQSIGMPPECIAFLHFRKALLNTYETAIASGDKAFATPRSWETAFDFYRDRATISGAVLNAAMAGTVGTGQANEFLNFVEVWQKVIPISQILADPRKCPLPDEQSMRYAVAMNCSGSMDVKTVDALHTYLARMDPEFVVMAWQLAIKRDAALFTTPAFLQFSKEYRAVFS